jgi:putative hydrolase of the HAD superfamily
MRFRAVLFDAAETLFTTRGSVGEIYAGVARHFGSQATPAAIQAAFARHFRGSGPVSVEDQKRWWKAVVYRVFNDVGMVENFDAFFDRLYDQFRNSEGWVLFPETRDVLEKLKSLDFKLGVISNFDTRLYSVLDDLRIRSFFDSVTTSSEAGFSKPDRRIFNTAVSSLGLPNSNILMVGDHPQDDVEAALRAGLSAVLVDRSDRYAFKNTLRRISSLIEVVGVVSEVTP